MRVSFTMGWRGCGGVQKLSNAGIVTVYRIFIFLHASAAIHVPRKKKNSVVDV